MKFYSINLHNIIVYIHNDVFLSLNNFVTYLVTFLPRVIDGFDILDYIEKSQVNEKTYRPLSDIAIRSITIHANPLAEL